MTKREGEKRRVTSRIKIALKKMKKSSLGFKIHIGITSRYNNYVYVIGSAC